MSPAFNALRKEESMPGFWGLCKISFQLCLATEEVKIQGENPIECETYSKALSQSLKLKMHSQP